MGFFFEWSLYTYCKSVGINLEIWDWIGYET